MTQMGTVMVLRSLKWWGHLAEMPAGRLGPSSVSLLRRVDEDPYPKQNHGGRQIRKDPQKQTKSDRGGNGMTFRPLPAKRRQCLRLERLLQHREHGLFLAPEMFPRGRQRLFEQPLRFRRIRGAMDAFEMVVNFVMILIQAVQRVPVGEGVIQGRIGQVRFCFAMAAQQALHHRRQQL